MPVIIIPATATVPEASKDRKAQAALRNAIDEALDDFEAKIVALGGVAQTDHATRREPGKRDLVPPPHPPVPASETDMVTLAQIATGVTEAAAEPVPTRADRRAA